MFNKPKEKNIKYFPLKDVLAYLRAHPLLLTNEKNNYSAEKLMMLLDNEKLAALEEEFNEHQNGIELPNFIWLMKSAISHSDEDKYDLVNGLIKLFQDIDINGDCHMEWSEFTQYIIDAVIGEKDTKFFDARFEKDREFTETEILDRAYSRKTKRYVMSKLFDNTLHSSTIKKISYCAPTDQILVLEQNSKKIKFYTPECLVKDNLMLPSEDRLQKAFILDFVFAESLSLIACISSDRQFIFWENSFNHRIIKQFKTDVLQTGIWYLEQHSFWITAGADNAIRIWEWNPYEEGAKEHLLFCHPNQVHVKQITEIIEITVPKLIATTSLDGKIKLWDLYEKMFISDLKDPSPHSKHSRGIRGATYSYDYGGNLLTFGFENYVNVWCPEISKTRAFIGKLEGHSTIIVACKFIPGSPNVISIDDKTNIRIWDIRTLATIQILSSEQGAAYVTDVAVIPKHDKFVLGGKRLIFYDNSAVSKSIKNFNDDICAVSVDYNIYYNWFVILTKIDLRLYDCLTGKLIKVFNDLHDEKIIVDLTNFCFGANERKFFIADNAGFIRVYNMKNGEFMKKVNTTNEIEGPEFSLKLAQIKKKENNEISQMVYLREDRLLITASWDSTIRIYDESEPEESVLLRIFTGGHQDHEIISLAYSSHFSLLASGSSNGLISIWDLESGKLEHTLLGHKGEINVLEFAEPFPILVSGSSEGLICIWGIRPISQRFKYTCICRLFNTIWEKGEPKNYGITALSCETELKKGLIRAANLNRWGYSKDEFFREEVLTSEHDYNKKKRGTVKPKNKEEEEAVKKEEWNKKDEGNVTYITESNAEFNETEEEWIKNLKNHEADVNVEKRRCYIIGGDSKGHMFVINLLELLNKRGIGEIEKYRKAQSYQLRRKDIIDATKQVEYIIQSENNNNMRKRDIMKIHVYNTVLFNKWEAHGNMINKITKIKEPASYITSSLDKHVKIWSLDGILLGDINLVKLGGNNVWKFPFDWVKNKLDDVEYVFETLEKIQKDRLTEARKNEIKANFFVAKYLYDIPDLEAVLYKREGEENAQFLEANKNALTNLKSSKNNNANYKNINVNSILEKIGYVYDENEKKFKKNNNLYDEPTTKINIFDDKNLERYIAENENPSKKKGFTLKLQEKLQQWEANRENMMESKRKMSRGSNGNNNLNANDEMMKKTTFSNNSNQMKNVLDKTGNFLKSPNQTAQHYNNPNSINIKKFPVSESIKIGKEYASSQTNWKKSEKRNMSPAEEARARTAVSNRTRGIFSSLTANNFFKNNHYIQNMIKGKSLTNLKVYNPQLDIKLREGEGIRALKLATVSQFNRFESESQVKLCDNIELLQKKIKFYKDLQSSSSKLFWDQSISTVKQKETDKNDNSIEKKKKDQCEAHKEEYKIIASKRFLQNANNNKHVILKSKNKIYVVDKRGD